MENQVILYQPNETIKVDVRLDGETVWLSQEQMCVLFGRERSVITKHIRNVFKEGELDERVSCAKFAPDALMVPDGKGGFVQNLHKTPSVGGRPLTYFNLDVIISVGYRVKSIQGTRFRQWATRVLREMLLSRCDEIRRLDRLEHRMGDAEREVSQVKSGMNYLIKQITTPPKPPKRKPIGFHVKYD